MGIYPGLKIEFLQTKTLKKNSIYAKSTPNKKQRKKIVTMIYPGYQIRGLRGKKYFTSKNPNQTFVLIFLTYLTFPLNITFDICNKLCQRP